MFNEMKSFDTSDFEVSRALFATYGKRQPRAHLTIRQRTRLLVEFFGDVDASRGLPSVTSRAKSATLFPNSVQVL